MEWPWHEMVAGLTSLRTQSISTYRGKSFERTFAGPCVGVDLRLVSYSSVEPERSNMFSWCACACRPYNPKLEESRCPIGWTFRRVIFSSSRSLRSLSLLFSLPPITGDLNRNKYCYNSKQWLNIYQVAFMYTIGPISYGPP